MSRSGGYCLASNPGTNYANNPERIGLPEPGPDGRDTSHAQFLAALRVEPNQDFGLIEVSLNQGSTWTRLYAVTGQSGANWQNAQVDLGNYAGSQVVIRFRLRSDGQNPYQGWDLDNIVVKDFGAVTFSYPFFDNMDSPATLTNWLGSAWQQTQGSAPAANGQSWHCLIGNNSYSPGGDLNCPLTLAGTVNLRNAVNPKWWFWWRAGTMYAVPLCANLDRRRQDLE